MFAGDATTTPVKCETLTGFDGEHVAILAKVTFHGPPAVSASTPAVTVSPDIQPQDVAQAGALLRRLFDQAVPWVPHEQEPSDKQMAACSQEQQHESFDVCTPVASRWCGTSHHSWRTAIGRAQAAGGRRQPGAVIVIEESFDACMPEHREGESAVLRRRQM